MKITTIKEQTASEFALLIQYKDFPQLAKIKELEVSCRNIVLKDVNDLPIAKHIVVNASDISKTVEARRKEVKEPYLKACKMIDDVVRMFIGKLNFEVEEAKKKIVSFQESRDTIRNFRKIWKYRVTNFNVIPPEFLTTDDIKINKFISENKERIKKGATEMIAGIEFYTENSLIL